MLIFVATSRKSARKSIKLFLPPVPFAYLPEVGTIDKVIDKSIIDNYRILKTL
jgi:hypothetical protein